MSRPALHTRLDRDVYQVLKRLEDANDGKPFKTIATAYDAIKRSNSSVSRQKKRPLEDAIDRAMAVRKSERAEDEFDSEAEIDIDEPEPQPPADERFLLNRQMIKHWNVEPAKLPVTNGDNDKPASKKRKAEPETGEENGTADAPTVSAAPSVTTPKEAKDTDGKLAKKAARQTRFEIKTDDAPPRMAGLGHEYMDLWDHVSNALWWPELFEQRNLYREEGYLITGPPGVGKRSLIRLLAAKVGVPVIYIEHCFDEPERMEKSLSEAFDAAIASQPCIMCIPDVEQYMGHSGVSSFNENQQRAVSAFRRQMQRVAAQGGLVLPMATSARPTDVAPSLATFGVLSCHFQLRVPDTVARREMFEIWTEGATLSPDVDLSDLVKTTHGFVGYDIRRVSQQARKAAQIRFNKTQDTAASKMYDTNTDLATVFQDRPIPDSLPITAADFQSVLKNYIPSLRKEGFTVVPNVTWDQVGALADVREQLHMSIIGPIRDPDLYRQFGLSRPAGCLLWGPPGCGKTLVAQAVANEAQASFILIKGPELLNKYVGESERAVRELFERARSSTPCLLFFDEIDALVPRRDGASTEAGTRVVNALLAELDGVADRSGIYVIGTTNRPDMIDAAMLRPGRLSVRLFLDLPTPDERADILRAIYRTNHLHATEEELAPLRAIAMDPRCGDFSGADLSGLHTKAAEAALRRYLLGGSAAGTDHIAAGDWEKALSESRRSVTNPETYRKLNAKLGRE